MGRVLQSFINVEQLFSSTFTQKNPDMHLLIFQIISGKINTQVNHIVL